MAIPAMGALVTDPILGLVDTAVAGRLGAEALGALGLGVAVLATVSLVFNFLVYGTTAAVARAIGADEPIVAGRRVAHAAWAALVLGLLAGLVVGAGARPLLQLLGAVPTIVDPSAGYLRVRAVGVAALLLTYVGHGAFRGVSDTRTPLLVAVAGTVLNALLNVVFVFGLGAGLVGIAWATVVAEVAMAVAFAALIRRAGLPLVGHGRPSRAEVAVLVVVSRDLFLRTAALVAGLLAVTAAAARVGAVTVAAHQVVWQVWVLVSFVMDGFAIAAQAMVGTALGAGRAREARRIARDLVRWGVGGGAVTAAVLVALGGVAPRLLTDDPAVLGVVTAAWWLAMGGHVVNGLVFVLDGVLMGAGDFAYLRRWALVGAAAAGAISQVAASAGGGLLWMWVAIEVMMLVRVTSLVLRLRGEGWLRLGAA